MSAAERLLADGRRGAVGERLRRVVRAAERRALVLGTAGMTLAAALVFLALAAERGLAQVLSPALAALVLGLCLLLAAGVVVLRARRERAPGGAHARDASAASAPAAGNGSLEAGLIAAAALRSLRRERPPASQPRDGRPPDGAG